MRGILSAEVPTLHGSLVTFTFGDGLHINELSDVEMAGAQQITNGQEVLWRNLEFCEVSLRRKVVLEEVSCLGFCEILKSFLSATYLYRVDTVFLQGLDLCDLASIDLYD